MQSASALPYVLDGSSSFSAIGKELNFQWSVVYQPVPNAVVLLSPTSVKPIFNTTAAGLYVVQLIVSNKDNPEIQSMPVTFSFVVP
ncbi:MAG: hypothetical protein QM527_12510 [Alphaproteobacteria bacterium]|nr:hypothetical protein [Alphaproteobacteria bacterium]